MSTYVTKSTNMTKLKCYNIHVVGFVTFAAQSHWLCNGSNVLYQYERNKHDNNTEK